VRRSDDTADRELPRQPRRLADDHRRAGLDQTLDETQGRRRRDRAADELYAQVVNQAEPLAEVELVDVRGERLHARLE